MVIHRLVRTAGEPGRRDGLPQAGLQTVTLRTGQGGRHRPHPGSLHIVDDPVRLPQGGRRPRAVRLGDLLRRRGQHQRGRVAPPSAAAQPGICGRRRGQHRGRRVRQVRPRVAPPDDGKLGGAAGPGGGALRRGPLRPRVGVVGGRISTPARLQRGPCAPPWPLGGGRLGLLQGPAAAPLLLRGAAAGAEAPAAGAAAPRALRGLAAALLEQVNDELLQLQYLRVLGLLVLLQLAVLPPQRLHLRQHLLPELLDLHAHTA
mmetsp:Transcript_37122/g.104747  ORF Transcript_37122/g.104747 Transcript_37122/m.104747 type:complete len:260 (+) Transcript_37122:219-998(+)